MIPREKSINFVCSQHWHYEFFKVNTRSVQKVSDFFLSQTAFNQITRAKRGRIHILHSWAIVKSFQADYASHSFFCKVFYWGRIIQAWRFCIFRKIFIVMTEQIGQRYCIKFCQKLGDTQIETIRKIQQVLWWCGLKPNPDKRMV